VLGDHKPARAISISPQLHFGALVEIQATAEAG
jgi:enamine deaminase RidA (YjgF/YER057c/UK114 family)